MPVPRRPHRPRVGTPVRSEAAAGGQGRNDDRVVGCTCFQVRRLARRVTQFYDRILAPCGLRVTQFSLLSRLLRHPLAMQSLAAALDMDRTTLTRNLKPLVDARLATLEPAGHDARVRLVRLTEAGRVRHAEAARLWRRAQDEINEHWGASEVASLHRLFAGLTATFNATPDDGPAGSSTRGAATATRAGGA